MKKFILGMILLCQLFFMMPVRVCKAGDKAEKARKAYDSFLSNSTIQWGEETFYETKNMFFDCVDMNGDKIPELVIECMDAFGGEGFQRVFSYVNGKVKRIWVAGNCIYASEYYKKAKILVTRGGRMGNFYIDYYKVFPNEVKLIGSYIKSEILDKNNKLTMKKSYSWNNKKVKKKRFNHNLKKIIGNAKTKEIKLVENTSDNRKKFFEIE